MRPSLSDLIDITLWDRKDVAGFIVVLGIVGTVVPPFIGPAAAASAFMTGALPATICGFAGRRDDRHALRWIAAAVLLLVAGGAGFALLRQV